MEENFRKVRVLSPDVARKIAAGEVIDRPNAIIRELLDNAIDAGASFIQVEISGGGIDKIRIIDDGYGMTKEDLVNCAYPHSTSKIVSDRDLMSLSTLGFRGEALSSIAAVSRLEIRSARRGSDGWKLEAYLTEKHVVTPDQIAKGTIVETMSLFENFPARRVFLKKPNSEAIMCRQTFIEKAIPWNGIGFKFTVDGKVKLDLPAGQSRISRFLECLSINENECFFHEVEHREDDFSFTVVLGDTNVFRNDRKQIYTFVNGRRIFEYSLVQAVEYGAKGYFPNGTFPVACLYLDIDPSLVDFNIHPAKKEVKFSDAAPIHKAISTAVRDFFRNLSVSEMIDSSISFDKPSDDTAEDNEKLSLDRGPREEKIIPHTDSSAYVKRIASVLEGGFKSHSGQNRSFNDRKELFDYEENAIKEPSKQGKLSSVSFRESNLTGETSSDYDFKYLGQTLGCFLIAERNGKVYFIDQHAAHERILFDRFMQRTGEKQKLLFPYVIETQSESDDGYLLSIMDKLYEAGFEFENSGGGRWECSAVPAQWKGSEEDLYEDLLSKHTEPDEILYSVAATNACRSAVKDGDVLDRYRAEKIVEGAFLLKDPHCPHGRPVFTSLSKDDLFQKVRRT